MATVDYYFSVLSSFSYLAGRRLEELAQRQGIAVHYKPLDIVALFDQTGGLLPRHRHPARQKYRLIEHQRVARKNGLTINSQAKYGATDDKPAAFALMAAQAAGSGNIGELAFLFLQAAYGEERDIADPLVIEDCLRKAGADPGFANAPASEWQQNYDANLAEALHRGVFGAPFYIVNETDEPFWGQDRLDDLEVAVAE